MAVWEEKCREGVERHGQYRFMLSSYKKIQNEMKEIKSNVELSIKYVRKVLIYYFFFLFNFNQNFAVNIMLFIIFIYIYPRDFLTEK